MNEMQKVDLFDERELWRELELEEPSKPVDAAVLEGAQRHQRALRQRTYHAGWVARRAVGFASAVLAVAAVITVTLWWPAETTPSFYPSAMAEDLGTAVRQLRVDVDQIGEISELIADDRPSQRDEILAKLAACQVRLEALESAIAKDKATDNEETDGTEGALAPTTEKQERRV